MLTETIQDATYFVNGGRLALMVGRKMLLIYVFNHILKSTSKRVRTETGKQ